MRVNVQDITNQEAIRRNPQCDRTVVLFGYLRGCNLRMGQRVHIAGVDDFTVEEVEQFPDPCPLPEALKKRGLNEQERRIYAPMSDIGGLLYDKDATYIDIPDWKLQYTRSGMIVPAEAEEVRCPIPKHSGWILTGCMASIAPISDGKSLNACVL